MGRKDEVFFAITFYLLTWEHSLCLNRADLLDISKQPHDRANLIEELKLFTKGREYAVFISRGESKDILKKSPTFIAKEKIVRGRFLVSEAKYPKSTKLSDAAAKSLSKHKGTSLSLSGLTELSEAALKFFVRKFDHFLVSAEMQGKISKNMSTHLQRQETVRKETELSDDALENLLKFKGDCLL